MLLKCCSQYANKFGKLSSGHKTGKGEVSFQSQRAMPRNVQTTMQLCSFHLLARLCSKSFKLGFSSMWTENLQMYKLLLEKAQTPEIKLPTSVRLWWKQENSRNTSTSASLVLKHLTMWITTNWCEIPQEMGILDYFSCLLRHFSQFSQFSRSVVSHSLRPHESQHARPPCPSPSPGVHSDSRPSSPWCHPAISSWVVPITSCPHPSQHQSLCQWVNSSHEVAKVLEFQLQHQSYQWTPRTDLL